MTTLASSSSPSAAPTVTAAAAVTSRPRHCESSLHLLSCSLCHQIYKQPKVLPCLHSFCEQCLNDVIPAESLSVTCPECRQQSILPLDGVCALQTNVFLLNLLNSSHLSSTCDSCRLLNASPTSKCTECQSYLCDKCIPKHVASARLPDENTPVNYSSLTKTTNHNNNNYISCCNNHSSSSNNNNMDSYNYNNGDKPPDPTTSSINNGFGCHHDDAVNTSSSNANINIQTDHTANGNGVHHTHHIVPLVQVSASDADLSHSPPTNGDTNTSSSICDSKSGGVVAESIAPTSHRGVDSIVCPNHAGNPLKYYCSHCDTAVCETCTQVEHIGHTTGILSDAIPEQKSTLTSLVSKVRNLIPDLERAVEDVEDVCKQLELNTLSTEVKISTIFAELTALLEDRKQQLLSELAQASAVKENVLLEQRYQLEDQLACMEQSCNITESSLASGSDTDVVMVKKEMAGRLNDFLTCKAPILPDTNALALFSENGIDTFQEIVSHLGAVIQNSAIPHKSTVGGEALSGCVVGKASTVTLTTKDRTGGLVRTGSVPIVASISSDLSETKLSPTITDHQNGTYDMTFVLSTAGVYYLSVMLFGQHTRGSPYKLRAIDLAEETNLHGSGRLPRTPVHKPKGSRRQSSSRSQGSSNRRSNTRIEDDLLMRIGVKGRGKGEFLNPQGVYYHQERVLVADSNNQNVQVFAASGECKIRFGQPGRAPGKIQRPTGIAVTQNGNFLVADYDNKWVSVFSPEGKYITRIGAGRLQGPKGVVVDKEGRIIVVDNKSSSILIFQSTGRLLLKFGSRGNRDHQLAGPHYAAISSNNDIAVTDFHNHCVKVFDRDGEFKFSFGSNGEGNGQFNAPTGIAIDDKGNMLVADWGNSRVQVFDSGGSFLSYVNTANEPLYGPQGLAVTTQGVLVVSDSGNHCIKYYKYLQ